jgi:hypothetical protein
MEAKLRADRCISATAGKRKALQGNSTRPQSSDQQNITLNKQTFGTSRQDSDSQLGYRGYAARTLEDWSRSLISRDERLPLDSRVLNKHWAVVHIR